MNPTEEANAERHYLLITVAVIIMIVGVYSRFADFKAATIVANILLIIGVAISLKAVFAILK
jgi:hypothetical protein